MHRPLALAALLYLAAAPAAHADTYTYVCKTKGKSSALKVDEARHELTWRRKTYKITELEAGGEKGSCPRFGWRAERQGEAFDFCTATQGAADFEENGAQI